MKFALIGLLRFSSPYCDTKISGQRTGYGQCDVGTDFHNAFAKVSISRHGNFIDAGSTRYQIGRKAISRWFYGCVTG